MVFVKVREVYDLNTVQNKVTVIGIHTPKADIIKNNYPGLLMQCKKYRPVKCDVSVACASMLPADPLQVSTTSGDIAPEDLFNPILYKACTNQGMSQIEARINSFRTVSPATNDVVGPSADVKIDGFTNLEDEFNLYYGMLADTHQWRHAAPQSGLSMRGLKPLVYEMLYSVADMNNDYTSAANGNAARFAFPNGDGVALNTSPYVFKGNAKVMPFINCTSYAVSEAGVTTTAGFTGTSNSDLTANAETFVPAPMVFVGAIIVPPSRLHQLYYRMVVEWTLEFSTIRSIGEITDWGGLELIGSTQHLQSYDYTNTAKAAGVEETNLSSDTAMVATDGSITKVM